MLITCMHVFRLFVKIKNVLNLTLYTKCVVYPSSIYLMGNTEYMVTNKRVCLVRAVFIYRKEHKVVSYEKVVFFINLPLCKIKLHTHRHTQSTFF